MRSLRLSKEIELLLGSIGSLQAIYLAIYAFLESKRNHKNLLLALLFLSLSIRIVKSLLWVYWDDTPFWFLNIGFLSHSASGPLLFLYAYCFVFKKKWNNWNFLHFLPSILLCFFIFSLTLDNFWYLGGYSVMLFQQIFYSIAGLVVVVLGILNRKNSGKLFLTTRGWTWIVILTVGTLVLQTAYFSNYVLGLTPYLLGPIVYAVFVYFLSFFGLRNPQIFKDRNTLKRYKNINISEEDLAKYKVEIQTVMNIDKPYLNGNFNLNELAEEIKIPAYLVSHVINAVFSQNFSDFINRYRIAKAKELLRSDDYKNLKISSVAYDCGFNSLSSFNVSFKKFTGITPSAYRNGVSDL